MIIQLNEIPSEGRSFDFSRKSGELNEVLSDLIGEHDYEVQLDVTPVGKSFDVRGCVKASYGEMCSFCASQFELPVNEKFHELVLIDGQNEIKGFDESWSPDGEVGVTVIDDPNKYDVSTLIREVVALAEPTQPVCREGCKGLCTYCGEDLNERTCNCAESQKSGNSPFSILKKLKLN
jgi:uncharacterized protein